MKKPKPKVVKHLNYHECAKYIESKLGYDLRDTLGKFKNSYLPSVEYRDFWHFIIDTQSPSNGDYIYIDSGLKEDAEPWQIEIIDRFIKEFGDDQEYWVEW